MAGIIHRKPLPVAIRALIATVFFFGSFTPLLGQTGPGGVGTRDGSSTLQLWLDAQSLGLADGTAVSSWTDRSGNGNNATQSTSGAQPTFQNNIFDTDKSVIRFDGTDDLLDIDGSLIVNSDYTVVLVAARRSTGGRRLWMGGTGTSANTNLHAGWNGTNFMANHWGNDHNAAMTGSAPGTTQGTFGIFMHGLDAGLTTEQRKIIQNGVTLDTRDNGTYLSSYPGAGLARDRGNRYDIDIAEFIMYNSALNFVQRSIVDNYLSAKYGITLGSNDYYDESASTGHEHDVIGIGYDGGASHTQANSAGFILSTYDGTFDVNGEYLMAGHNNVVNAAATDSLQAGVAERWARSWYVDKTTADAVNAALTFDLGEGIPGGEFPQEANNYVLLRYNTGTSTYDSVAVAAKIITGDQITFRVADANLTDGIYTLGSTDATVSPVAGLPGTTWYSYQSGNWTDPNVWTLDGGVSPLLVNPGNEIPGNNDHVVITSGRTITLDTDDQSVASMEVTGRLDMAATSGHNFSTISGRGRIRMQGYDHDASGATPEIDNFPAGDATAFANAATGGTVELYGSGFTLDQARTFRNLVVNLTNATDIVTQLADITLNGNLTVTRGDYRINDNTATTVLDLEVFGNVLVDTDGRMSVGEGNTIGSFSITGGTLPASGQYHQIYHQIVMHANFTNNGTVRLTNETAPRYNEFSTLGAATVRFNGSTDNTANLNNVTDFYNLIIDKGTDQTYALTINSADASHFSLFGPNNVGRNQSAPFSGANPEVRKALFIQNGTLRLTGNILIPTLTEGNQGGGNGDYTIGANAALHLDGPNVRMYTTANDNSTSGNMQVADGSGGTVTTGSSNQALSVFGKLLLSDGYLSTRNSAGLIFWAASNGTVQIEGGILDASQVRTSGTGVTSYVQTGGLADIRGNTGVAGEVSGSYALFNIDNPEGVFQMSGGELRIRDNTGYSTGGLLITSAPGNINVTGGVVSTDYAGTVEINSTAPFHNFVIETHTVDMQSTLRILNDLTIRTGTTRTGSGSTYGGYLDLCPDGTNCFDLEVGRNLTIEDYGVLDVFNNAADNAGSATVTFNGTENGIFNIGDITTLTHTLTGYDDPGGSGNIYDDYRLPIYAMIIDKPGDTLRLQANGPVNDSSSDDVISGNKNIRATKSRLLYVRDQFAIRQGATLNQIDPNNDGLGYSMRLYTNTIELNGNLFVYEQGVNPTNAFVEFGGGNGTITINSTASSTIGNIVTELINDEIELTSDLTVGRFAFRHGGVNLGTHNLKIDVLDINPENGGSDNVRLRTINNGNNQNREFIFGVNGSDANQFFYTAGNASDGGLSLRVPRETNLSGTDTDLVGADPNFEDIHYEYQNRNLLWFPIGVDPDDNGSGTLGKYTPAVVYLHDNGTTDGDEYITVRPVDNELQTTDLSIAPASDGILSYYWNVDFEGYASGEEPTVSWLFQYDDADADVGDLDETNYVPGKVLDGGAYSRSDDGDTNAVKDGGNANKQGDIIGNNPRNIIIFNGSTDPANDNINGVNQKVFNTTPSGGDTQVDSDPTNTNWQDAFPGTGFPLENANYTAGEAARFVGSPTIYYSRRSANWSNNVGSLPQWNQNNTWSTDPTLRHSGSAAASFPEAGDIAIIRLLDGGDLVNVGVTDYTGDAGIDAAAAELQIYRENEAGTDQNNNRLYLTEDATASFARVRGNSTIQVFVSNAEASTFLNTDFGDFISDNGAQFLFFAASTGVLTLPTEIPEYPNIRLHGIPTANGYNASRFDYKFQFPFDVNIRQDVFVDRWSTLRVNRNITIGDDLRLGSFRSGELEFEGSNGQVQLTVLDEVRTRSHPHNRMLIIDSNSNHKHRFSVKGDIDFDNNTVRELDFFTNLTGGDNVILEFAPQAGNNQNFNNADDIVPELYQVVMNGGSSTATTFKVNTEITLPAASTTPDPNFFPIEILNGLLVLNQPDIEVTAANGANWLLPNLNNPAASSGSGGLEIAAGVVRLEGNNTGLILDGLLRVSGGTVDMATGAGNGNNFIQYSASGNALLEVSAGTLDVGSHIRRSTTNTSGVLRYRQTGGTVNIGTQTAPLNNRALFEVLNAGSEFTLTGGDFNILRQNGTNPSIASLLLDPDTYDLTGSTINIGGTATPASQTITINSTVPLNNMTVQTDNSPVARIRGRALNIDGTLTINGGASFDANGWALNMGGDFVNDGTFTANGNTTIFSGSAAQQISGTATGGTTFLNLAKNGSNTLSLSSHNLTVEGNLEILQGTLNDGGNTITLRGNMLHQGTHTTPATTGGAGIVFAGSSRQELRGLTNSDIDLGKLTINNGAGVVIPDGNGYNFTINEALRLSAGVLDIGGSLLTLTTNAALEEVSTFGPNNMIQTNSSFTDNGFRRNFNAISTTTSLMFPVGQTYYTPVRFNIDGSSAGSLTVRPANERHPSIIEDLEAPDPEIVDSLNVLQYHWIVSASGISGFTGDAVMTYNQTTVEGNEAAYIPARLYNNSTSWDKSLPVTNVDEGTNTIRFDWDIAVNDSEITGDYTAGLPNAIPDEVPVYITDETGDYTAGTTWTKPVGATYPDVTDGIGPIGAIIRVESGHTLTFNENNIRVYRTEIRGGGTLNVAGTFGHRLGDVSGTGTLRISSDGSSAVLPAGFYTDFLSCSGGGLEYAGIGSYDVLGGIPSLRNLTLSGSGSRNLPANSITICNDLTLDGPTLENTDNVNITVQNNFIQDAGTFNAGSGSLSVTNTLDINGGIFNGDTGDKTINGALDLATGTLNVGSDGTFTVRGNVTNTGTFNGGSGSAVFALAGSAAQSVSGTFTGTATFHRLQINNAAGVNFGGAVDVSTELRLTNGRVNNAANTFTLAETAVVTPTGGSSSSYVTGQLNKVIADGASFSFPIGKGSRFARAQVNSVDHASGASLTWRAEYIADNPENHASVDNLTPSDNTILTMSGREYWVIADDAGVAPTGAVSATIGISWDAGSNVSTNTADHADLSVMIWDDPNTEWDDLGGASHSGDATFGELMSVTAATFSEQIFTLGSTSLNNPLPVELISFTAEMDGRVALLQWETASERNNDFFEVQRSVNGQDWSVLGIVEGNGDSDVPLSYDYRDRQPLLGVSYYRLRQVDYDGRFEYSKVISLENAGNALGLPEPEILLYPNPGKIGQVHIRVLQLKPNEEVQLSLADTYGRTFMDTSLSAAQLEAGYKLDSDRDLPAGMYVVSIKQGRTQLQKKLIIR